MIVVTSWGIGGRVVDAGRVGRGAVGQSRGGAVDVAALALANRLVGNRPHEAGIETSGGLSLRVDRPTMIAVTGADADLSTDSSAAVGWGAPVVLGAGATLRVGRLRDGMRTYVGVRGGVRRDGDELTVGADPGTPASGVVAVRTPVPEHVDVWPGPRLDWFVPDAWDTLTTGAYTVGPASDRVGVRLHGPALVRVEHRELASEGMIEGAVQVPPDGQPIIMLADHPTTGGYPVIAVVDPRCIPTVAQLAPGTTLRLRPARTGD